MDRLIKKFSYTQIIAMSFIPVMVHIGGPGLFFCNAGADKNVNNIQKR